VEVKIDSRACGTYTAEEVHVGLWWENEVEWPLARPSSRWEDNVKIGLKEIEWEVVGWITVAQGGFQS
jgi:hypothetical protein